MRRYTRKGFTLVELMVVIGILGLLVGILAVAVLPKLVAAKNKLEIKQVGDLMAGFNTLQTDDAKRGRLKTQKSIAEAKGVKFYEEAFKNSLLDDSLLTKIVSLNSSDTKATKDGITEPGWTLAADSCSYTAPKGNDLILTLTAKNKDRAVFLTFNSRNWANYGEEGVLAQWSDGEVAVYITKQEATENLKLDGEMWTSNPKDIIGQKKPFQRTFE